MKKIEFLLIFLILILAIITRFWQLEGLGYFTMDEEYANYLARRIANFEHFPLIGVNAADTGLYLGPGFIYLSAIIFFLTSGNPLGQLVVGSLLGVVVTLLLFFIGRELFSTNTGAFASLLYAGSFLATIYDRRFWNPSFMPLLALLAFYTLTRIARGERKTWLFILLFLALGLSLHSHFSMVVYFLAVALVFIIFKISVKSRSFGFGVLAFFFTQLPLLLFELRHNFLNSKALLILFKEGGGVIGEYFAGNLNVLADSLSRFIYTAGSHDLANELVLCPSWSKLRADPVIFSYLGIIFLIIYVFFFKRKEITGKEKITLKVTGIIFLTTLVSLIFSPRIASEYYFLYLFPVFALLLGFLLAKSSKGNLGILALAAVVIFLIFNLSAIFSAKHSFSLRVKKQAIEFVRETIGQAPFELESLGSCHRFEGYRFLFDQAGLIPTRSYVDPYFSWIYGENTQKPKYTVVLVGILPTELREETDKWLKIREDYNNQNIIAKNNFGDLEVMIVRNN